jgi:hypothetical protein
VFAQEAPEKSFQGSSCSILRRARAVMGSVLVGVVYDLHVPLIGMGGFKSKIDFICFFECEVSFLEDEVSTEGETVTKFQKVNVLCVGSLAPGASSWRPIIGMPCFWTWSWAHKRVTSKRAPIRWSLSWMDEI